MPPWQKALPFLVLAPAPAIANGSLISLLIVAVTLIAVKASRRPTLAFAGDSWLRNAVIGVLAGLLLVVPVRPGVGAFAPAMGRADQARQLR